MEYPDIEKAYKLKAKKEKEEAKQIVKEEVEAKPKEEVKEKEKKKIGKPSPLLNLKNKEITLHLRSNNEIKGTLLDEWRYEILIKNEKGEFIIFKHSIDYITH